jgi:hypothetical protein
VVSSIGAAHCNSRYAIGVFDLKICWSRECVIVGENTVLE